MSFHDVASYWIMAVLLDLNKIIFLVAREINGLFLKIVSFKNELLN
jgi:hypothetical protein